MAGVWDAPTGCSGGPAPGATSLLERGLQNFPGVSSGGIYSCRQTRTGSGLSEHAEGRAVDFMAPSRKLGDALAAWAIRIPGVQTVIWNDRIWSSTRPTWRPYGDSSGRPFADPTLGHRDHVHVGLTRAAAGSSATGAGVAPGGIQGLTGAAVAGVAGFGGDLVEAAVDPLLTGLRRIWITGALLTMGAALVVAGGYRTVTGRRITGDAAKMGGAALEAGAGVATGGTSTAATTAAKQGAKTAAKSAAKGAAKSAGARAAGRTTTSHKGT